MNQYACSKNINTGTKCPQNLNLPSLAIITSVWGLKVKGTHEFREFEKISDDNSLKWVTQMLGTFCMCIWNWQLNVYWKQLSIRAAIISASQTTMKLIQRWCVGITVRSRMWLDCFISMCHHHHDACASHSCEFGTNMIQFFLYITSLTSRWQLYRH